MIKISMQTNINASSEAVWAVVGNFNALPKFVEAAVKSEVDGSGIGAIRTITLPDGSILKERLEEFNETEMMLKYSIVEGPLPVSNYLSTMQLADNESGCQLTWSSNFDAAEGVSEEESEKTMAGIYQMGFDGLVKLFA